MDIVQIIKDQLLNSGLLSKLAGSLGMDAADARKATDAAVPTMLAGLSSLASTPDGARKLDAAVDGIDDGANPADALASGGARFIDNGGNMLSSLFGGGMMSGIASAIAKCFGMNPTSITGLLSGLAPIVLGALKGQKRSLGLDASGLAGLLNSQKNNIASALPAECSNMLASVPGLSGVANWFKGAGGKAADAAGDAADWALETTGRAVDRTREMASSAYDSGRTAVGSGARATAEVGSSASRWAIPVIAVLALGALLWWWAASNRSRSEQARVNLPSGQPSRLADAARDTAADAGRAADAAASDIAAGARDVRDAAAGTAQDATAAARDAAGGVAQDADATLAGAKSAAVNPLAKFQSSMTDTFSSATKTFAGITDAVSAEKAIPTLKALPEQLKSLQTSLSALPADSVSKWMATVRTSAQTLSTGIDKAMAIPAVADKIRPYVSPIQAQLKAIVPATQPSPGAAAGTQ